MKYWITLQLSEKGESLLEDEPETLERILKKFTKVDYFLPLHFNKSKAYENKVFLFKGYIFLEYNKIEIPSYARLSATQYFIGPLLVGRKLHLIHNDEIKKLKKQLIKKVRPVIRVGDKVQVLDGKYKNLQAIVTEYYCKEKEADLTVDLKCMSILVPRIPITCLKNISNEEKTKNSLLEKIIQVLEQFPKGLTRKQIVSKVEVNKSEKKRISTCLARSVKRKIISSARNSNRKFIFVYNKN